ncbi:hypothetical protein [Nocardia bhagyanarayanae]|uniref:Uncharacterized protein n=1 Tax=Nocardia bhagyanarayanae TaxID=1215925 RepID=A0A543F4R8_9NOCA|nr:hypothetical protein [Nocardia bhagyanarayanae]TQM28814.1 hypothetical protein FB390_0389 [Nocardia bhagyanarayanae]
MPDEPSTGNSEIAALAQRVATARGKLPLQHDTALVEVLSDSEIAAERELAEWIRAQRRAQRRRAVEDELAAEKLDRRTAAAIRRADEDDARWHRRALAARRRVANQDARLAQLYRRAEWSSRALIGVVVLGMVWAGVNVQHNLVPSGDMSDPLYWLSYGIEAMISIPIITIMVVATTAARWGRELPRGKVIVFEAALLGTTIALNTGPHLASGDLGRAAEYAIAPAMVGVVIWLHAWVAARYAQLIDSVPIVDDTAVPKLRGSYQGDEYQRAVPERDGYALGSGGFGAGPLFDASDSVGNPVGSETATARVGTDPLGVGGEIRLTSASNATAPSAGSEPASVRGRADRLSDSDANVPSSANSDTELLSHRTGQPAATDANVRSSVDSTTDLPSRRTDRTAETNGTVATSADGDTARPNANRRTDSPSASDETGPTPASDRAGEPSTNNSAQPAAADAELESGEDEIPTASEQSDIHAPMRSISYAVPLSLLTGGLTDEDDDATPPSPRRNGSNNGRTNHPAAHAVPLSQPRLRPINGAANGNGRTNGSGHTPSMWAGSHALSTIAYPQADAAEATDALSTTDAVDLAEFQAARNGRSTPDEDRAVTEDNPVLSTASSESTTEPEKTRTTKQRRGSDAKANDRTDTTSRERTETPAEQLTLEPEPEPHRPRSTEIILATQRAIAEDAEDDFDQEPDSAEDEVRMVARSIAEQGLSKLPIEQIADILTLADQSWSGTGIAKEVGVSSSAVARVIDSAHKVRRPYATNS